MTYPTVEHAESDAEVIRDALSLIAPIVQVRVSSLGGSHSLLIHVSLDHKEDWPNSIVENSRYSRFHLTGGRLDQFARSYKIKSKLRAGKVKSASHAADRIAGWIEKAMQEGA